MRSGRLHPCKAGVSDASRVRRPAGCSFGRCCTDESRVGHARFRFREGRPGHHEVRHACKWCQRRAGSAGRQDRRSRLSGQQSGFALVRYRRNGSLDPTFGSHGRVTTSFSPDRGDATSLARQPDGKIIVAGSGYDSSVGWIVLARYGRTGRLDAGFGTGGIVKTRFSDSKTESVGSSDVAVQPNGKIVAVGARTTLEGMTLHNSFALVRYLRDGTLDTSFGTGGKVTTATDAGAGSVALKPDGKIVVAGSNGSSSQPSCTVARYNTDGSLDQTFGSAGIVKTTPGSFSHVAAVMVQQNGKILVVGSAGITRAVFALARYNRNGTLDSSFGSRGIVKVDSGQKAARNRWRPLANRTGGSSRWAGTSGTRSGSSRWLASARTAVSTRASASEAGSRRHSGAPPRKRLVSVRTRPTPSRSNRTGRSSLQVTVA